MTTINIIFSSFCACASEAWTRGKLKVQVTGNLS